MSFKLKKMTVLLVAIFMIAFPLGGCTTTKQPPVSKAEIKAEKERAKVNGFQTYRRRLKKLNDVAYPTLVASADLAKKKRWSYGILYDSLKGYKKKDRNLAERAFPALSNEVSIIHLIKGSPGAASGLRNGDILEEYNGKKVKQLKDMKKAFKELSSPEYPGPGKFVFSRDGERVEVSIEPKRVAAYKVNLIADQKVNAWADGKSINLTYGIMRFTENDDELALIIGHELAHNTEGHPGKAMLKTSVTALPVVVLGVATAAVIGTDFGMTSIATKAIAAKYSRDHEREADYVGTYIAARAGYDIDGASDFWRRFSSELPKSMKEAYDSSHPSSPERTVRIDKIIAEIQEKKARELPLLPERK